MAAQALRQVRFLVLPTRRPLEIRHLKHAEPVALLEQAVLEARGGAQLVRAVLHRRVEVLRPVDLHRQSVADARVAFSVAVDEGYRVVS